MITNPNNKIEDFLAKLAQKTPKAKDESAAANNRKLDKVYLNYPGNFGRYQIFPMDSVITDFPFITLFNTREINIPRKNISVDGQETVYNAWIRILPKDAYLMRDDTGRAVSSLTASDEQLLHQAYAIFDQLFEELDPRNNRDNKSIVNLLRKRNYTIFHGYCINKWGLNDVRNPERQNFSALFVCTAKGFMNAVDDSIKDKVLMENGDNSWLGNIYTKQTSNRDGFIMFSIAPNKLQAGYSVSVTHEFGKSRALEGISIPEEDAELMTDPIYSFLGWQAAKDDNNIPGQRRLFNASLIQEAIQFMTQQLAAVRMAKNSGVSLEEAIQRTNQEALNNQTPTNTMGEMTNDPMLASMVSAGQPVGNPGNIVENNNNPFQTPPAANIDPVTSAPVTHSDPVESNPFGNSGNGSTPFSPGFNGFGGQF